MFGTGEWKLPLILTAVDYRRDCVIHKIIGNKMFWNVRFIGLCIIFPVHYRVMTLGTCFATWYMSMSYCLYHFLHRIVFHAEFHMFIICQCNIKHASLGPWAWLLLSWYLYRTGSFHPPGIENISSAFQLTLLYRRVSKCQTPTFYRVLGIMKIHRVDWGS